MPVVASINCDLEAAGKRDGSLHQVCSDNQHAFDTIAVPIAVIRARRLLPRRRLINPSLLGQ